MTKRPNWPSYSITSSRAGEEDGMTTPSAVADLRLMTSSNFRRLLHRQIGRFRTLQKFGDLIAESE